MRAEMASHAQGIRMIELVSRSARNFCACRLMLLPPLFGSSFIARPRADTTSLAAHKEFHNARRARTFPIDSMFGRKQEDTADQTKHKTTSYSRPHKGGCHV